jgi:hypothetical protein
VVEPAAVIVAEGGVHGGGPDEPHVTDPLTNETFGFLLDCVNSWIFGTSIKGS